MTPRNIQPARDVQDLEERLTGLLADWFLGETDFTTGWADGIRAVLSSQDWPLQEIQTIGARLDKIRSDLVNSRVESRKDNDFVFFSRVIVSTFISPQSLSLTLSSLKH